MLKSQDKLKKLASKLPQSPGVYFFVGNRGKILYVGKATSLRSRVLSYFASDITEKRSELIGKMVGEAKTIKHEKTDSVLEALILEAELIKRHLPPYNSVGKDQRSWNYVVITNEKFPRVLIMRGKELEIENLKLKIKEQFGPFTNSSQLREAMKIIRRIFPYRDEKCILPENQQVPKPCFNYQIGLCPGTCIGKVSEKEYSKTIKHIQQFFSGNKKQLVKDLEREMKSFARDKKFEEAEILKRKVFSLKHIEDIALIKRDRPDLTSPYAGKSVFRIESYDVAHTSSKNVVGVMTVIENGEIKKSDYRLFKIRGKGGGDTAALSEILERRLNHTEWLSPDLIIVDGGIAQLNAAKLVLEKRGKRISLVSVTKDEHHKAREIQALHEESKNLIKHYKREILLANAESHRFAIGFHRKLRGKLF